MICRQCGNEISMGHSFCGHCGTSVNSINTPQDEQSEENNFNDQPAENMGGQNVNQYNGWEGQRVSRDEGWQRGPVQDHYYTNGEGQYPSAVSVSWERPETLLSSVPKGRGRLKLKGLKYQAVAIVLGCISLASWLAFLEFSYYGYADEVKILLYIVASLIAIGIAAAVRKGPVTALPAVVLIAGEILMWFDVDWETFTVMSFMDWSSYTVLNLAVSILTIISIVLFLSGAIRTAVPAFVCILLIELNPFIDNLMVTMDYVYDYGLIELGYFLLDEMAFYMLYASIAVAFANLTREKMDDGQDPFV